MFLARRKVKSPRIRDVRGTVLSEMRKLKIQGKIQPGMQVTVTAGIRDDSKLKLVFPVAFLEIADRLAKTNWESH